MIDIKPKFDGSNGFVFVYSQEEVAFLKENLNNILDKFVQSRIKNIGNMKIKTFKDYVDFCTSSPKNQLEKIEGHKIKFSDFNEIELFNAFMLSNEATKGLAFSSDTAGYLKDFVNEMFEIGLNHEGERADAILAVKPGMKMANEILNKEKKKCVNKRLKKKAVCKNR